jgi:GTP-binding protein HflX
MEDGMMEKVIAVGIQRQGETDGAVNASMEELEELVRTAGGEVVEIHTQKKDRPDPATFIGKGKAAELAERVILLKVRTLVFDDELKPVQQRNLEEVTGAKVVDRTRLILDIFAQRARTREGILQVELAQLKYMLPRITSRFGRFEQQTGGIGSRGPGERKLEVDQRRIRDRMAALQKQIEDVSGERTLQRSVRRSIPVPQAALVGYTNAGKSTLLNALLKHSAGAPKADRHRVYADDKLFATLDPTTRRVRLASGRIVLFTDTVGFIRKLPTELIASFRATLEETASADLLVHVLDVSAPDWRAQEHIVLEILKDLHMDHLPRLTAYNKMDCLSPTQKRRLDPGEGFALSAKTGEGMGEFLRAVETRLTGAWIEKEIFVPHTNHKQLALIHEHTEVISQVASEEGLRLRVRAHPDALAKINDAGQ